MKKKTELKFYATKKRSKQSLQPKEQGFLTTSIQANRQPAPHYQTSRPSRTKTTKLLSKRFRGTKYSTIANRHPTPSPLSCILFTMFINIIGYTKYQNRRIKVKRVEIFFMQVFKFQCCMSGLKLFDFKISTVFLVSRFFLCWPSWGEHLFDHLLWSIFQSLLHIYYKLHFFMISTICQSAEYILELYICIQIRINQLLIFIEKFSPLLGFEPRTSWVPSRCICIK